jgi:sulfate adenylyltransferase
MPYNPPVKTSASQPPTPIPRLAVTGRELCDLEMLLDGSFAPLDGFLGSRDYTSVLERLRLADGRVWPMPITLPVSAELAAAAESAGRLELTDPTGILVAELEVAEHFIADPRLEAEAVFGTTDPDHPGVAAALASSPHRLAGTLRRLGAVPHEDFLDLRLGPAAVRAHRERAGWERLVAFQTRNPLHRAHGELVRRAAAQIDGAVLLHPVVGRTRPGDLDATTRVRCYRAVLPRLGERALLAVLPLAMRMGGPREALWHSLIRANYGCTHIIIGRDHAGPGSDASGRPWYGPYEAQELVAAHADEIGIEPVFSKELVYVTAEQQYRPVDEVPAGADVGRLSGTEMRDRLARRQPLPQWFSYPEVERELVRGRPAPGAVVFLTGLPSAGKSTIATRLAARLAEHEGRASTVLDGDLVRRMLSAGLGFSREDREANIRRIGWVAAEVARHGGIAIAAAIAPFAASRGEARQFAREAGAEFVLVHVATSPAVCEQRDPKGLWAKARAGEISGFTGVSDPYEAPADAELILDAGAEDPDTLAARIQAVLEQRGILPGSGLS